MSARFRNAPCPCGSGRKFKHCCADALEHPKRIAQQHDAVGRRIQAWASENHREAMRDAFDDITSGYTDRVLDGGVGPFVEAYLKWAADGSPSRAV